MFRIAICDDEKIFRDDLKEILIRYMTDRGIMLEIDTFSSGKEFVELGIEMVKYKIVFLDINMDELDGIMTAKKIRENSKDMFIVFVTAFVNYTIEGYKVDAVRYILKDNKNLFASVYECMDAIHEKMDYKITWAEFDFCEGTRKVSLNRILYIESKLHKLEFHVMEDCLQKYVFSTDADGSELRAAELWFDETEQKWNGWELCVESAFQTPYFGGEYSEDVAEHLQEIVLGNSDHAAADMCVLYDSEENVIRDTNTIYHKQ